MPVCTVPLFRASVPGSLEVKSLMHTYNLSPALVLGMGTSSTKVLGNWPAGGAVALSVGQVRSCEV